MVKGSLRFQGFVANSWKTVTAKEQDLGFYREVKEV
jgi:hypothetical protein